MMPPLQSDPGRLREAATRSLAHEVGRGRGRATSEDLAAAAGRLLDRLWQRLARVVGHAGVQALFLRAVKLRKVEFSFLDERVASRRSGESVGESFRTCLQEQEPDVIRTAFASVFATLARLLASLIGDGLAWALLRDAWPEIRKTRDGTHSEDLRSYDLDSSGLIVGLTITMAERVLTSEPHRTSAGPAA